MEPEIIGVIESKKLKSILVESAPVKFYGLDLEAGFVKYGNHIGVMFVRPGDIYRHRTLGNMYMWDVFYWKEFFNSKEANSWVVQLKQKAGVPVIPEWQKALNIYCKKVGIS